MQKNKYTFIIYLFLAILIFGNINEIKATHIMGGDFSYVCLGNNQYAVTLRLFRDCNGISLNNTTSISLSSSCGNFNETLNLNGNPVDRTPVCVGAPTRCDNPYPAPAQPDAPYGIFEYFYRGTIMLPGNCSDWIMSWDQCCRNNAITTLANPGSEGTYIDAQLDATICNNAPAFNNDPTFFLCVNQENRYNFGAVDIEGDSLIYSFMPCRNNSSSSYVAYSSGLSGTNPLVANTQTINAQNGEIIIVPTITQVGVICIRIEEFRNNQKIGEITRDLQFTVIDCNNNTLPILSGIDGTADSTGYTGAFSVDICANEEAVFYIQGFDAEAVPSVQSQNLELLWNYGIQGSAFIVDYNVPYPKAEFKWTPTSSDVGTHYFYIIANDDACPILGTNIFAYQINVLSSLTANITTSMDTLLMTNNDTVLLDVSTNISSSDLTYSWTPTTGLSCTDCPSPMYTLPSTFNTGTVIYTVNVTDLITGCSATDNISFYVINNTSVNSIPQTLTSWEIFPNPVVEHSLLSYELSKTSQVSIEIYDLLGKRIAFITKERQLGGKYQYSIGQHLKNQSAGVYFISMQIDGERVTKKLIIK